MKVRFFVICFGEKALDLYERIAVRSLVQPRNKGAIPEDAVVALYSDAASIERASRASEALGRVEPHVMESAGNPYDVQNRAFIEEVGRSVREDAAIVIVNPDCFWGDGSLATLISLAEERDSVAIAVPHVRVDSAGFTAALPSHDLSNADLVSLSMQTLHASWIDADIHRKETSALNAGVSIQHLGNGLHAVTHLLPTVFLAKVNARDYGFFAERQGAQGLWDHAWPQILANDNRQRTIGSSDAAFIAELTDAGTHEVPLTERIPGIPDAYRLDGAHIRMNRSVLAIWRENNC